MVQTHSYALRSSQPVLVKKKPLQKMFQQGDFLVFRLFSATCPDSRFLESSGMCYFGATQIEEYITDAMRDCYTKGSELVKINSRNEQLAVEQVIRALNRPDGNFYWTGIKVRKVQLEGTTLKWFDMDNESLSFANFKSGEAEKFDQGNIGNNWCVIVSPSDNFKWTFRRCDRHIRYADGHVCESMKGELLVAVCMVQWRMWCLNCGARRHCIALLAMKQQGIYIKQANTN